MIWPTAWSTVMELWVPGKPIPQGSMVAIPLGRRQGNRFMPVLAKDGRPVVNVIASNEGRLTPWRGAISTYAMEAWGGRESLDEDVCVWVEFRFERPKNHYDTRVATRGMLLPDLPLFPRTPKRHGDSDKLVRSVFDALDHGGVFTDDIVVVEHHSRRVWCAENEPAGALVWVQIIPPNNDTDNEGDMTLWD